MSDAEPRQEALAALAGRDWQSTDKCHHDLYLVSRNNAIHSHRDGTLWFWDETSGWEYGPFVTSQEATHAFDRYCAALDGDFV